MWFRLAALYGCPVEEAQERTSSLEFNSWIAFYNAEPWGYEMDNWRAGMVAATIANVAPRAKGAKGLTPQDFYPITKKGEPKLSSRRQKQLEDFRARKARKKGKR